MFNHLTKVTYLDLSTFITSDVLDMDSMFLNMNSLSSLDISNLDTKNVKNMRSMFQYCRNLISINIKFRCENIYDIYAKSLVNNIIIKDRFKLDAGVWIGAKLGYYSYNELKDNGYLLVKSYNTKLIK
jgi:surface protein